MHRNDVFVSILDHVYVTTSLKFRRFSTPTWPARPDVLTCRRFQYWHYLIPLPGMNNSALELPRLECIALQNGSKLREEFYVN